ncbi:MAG: DUF6538 domain-containing protein [Pseudomonadota bacterium]
MKYLFQRGGSWLFRRRVPDDIRHIVGKREWVASIGDISQQGAIQLALRHAAGTDQAIISARAKAGSELTWADEVVIEDNAIERLVAKHGSIEAASIAYEGNRDRAIQAGATPRERALLTGKTTLSQALARDQQLYPVTFQKHQAIGFRNFIAVNGDVPVDEVTRDQVMAYVTDCRHRGQAESSTKRRLGAMGAVVNRYYQDFDITRRNPFSRVPLIDATASIEDRVPLDEAQVAALDEYLLASTHLRPRTLALLWLVRSSTLGPSEAGGLMADDVVLDHEVPHVIVRPNEIRRLKVKSRRRVFPLVGKALEYAEFLPTKTFSSNSTSAALNKHLRKGVELRPRQSAYSLRHRMRDRLYAAGASNDQARYLMGHAARSAHDRYGSNSPRLNELAVIVRAAL